VVGPNFVPNSSRPSALAAVAPAHQMGNAQFIGMVGTFLMSLFV